MDMSTKELAIEKIEKEAQGVSGQNVPSIAIYSFIKSRCEEDEGFAAKVLNEKKSLSGCFTYLTNRAFDRAQAQTGGDRQQNMTVGMSGDEIFNIVVEYFDLDEEALEAKRKAEKEAAEAAKKAAEEQRKADEKRKAEAKAEKERIAAQIKKNGESQLNFFGEANESEGDTDDSL